MKVSVDSLDLTSDSSMPAFSVRKVSNIVNVSLC